MKNTVIAGIGTSVPDKILTNAEIEKIVDTTDEWIVTRTGIRERRIAEPGDGTSRWASQAALAALANAGMQANEIDLIVNATSTPDQPMPSCATRIQKLIGANNAACFDLAAACAGFVYALSVGCQFVNTGVAKNVLVIGADQLSSFVDWKDRSTCVLFGDAAGACILKKGEGRGVIDTMLGADGNAGELIKITAGGSARPTTKETVAGNEHFIQMNGQEVFKLAVRILVNSVKDLLARNGVGIDDIACVVPHQANKRILDAVAGRLKLKEGQMFINLDRYGNTSAASVVVGLREAVDQGFVKKGDLVVLTTVGAGMVWGSTLLEW